MIAVLEKCLELGGRDFELIGYVAMAVVEVGAGKAQYAFLDPISPLEVWGSSRVGKDGQLPHWCGSSGGSTAGSHVGFTVCVCLSVACFEVCLQIADAFCGYACDV